jgi:hypothetical protein
MSPEDQQDSFVPGGAINISSFLFILSLSAALRVTRIGRCTFQNRSPLLQFAVTFDFVSRLSSSYKAIASISSETDSGLASIKPRAVAGS